MALTGFVYVSFTIRCKGPILSNPWIWMDKETRIKELAKVDIKAEYRQLTIVLGCLSLGILSFAVYVFLESRWQWVMYLAWVLIAISLLYAIVSSIVFFIRNGNKL